MQVLVRDNNVDQALRVLKKRLQREGVFREMRRRRFCERTPPSSHFDVRVRESEIELARGGFFGRHGIVGAARD